MAATFPLEVVTPERVVYRGEVAMVTGRTLDGEIAFLAGHIPLVGGLAVNEVRIHPEEGEPVVAAVHGGVVQMRRSGELVIAAPVAELAGEIDVARAQRALEASSAAGDTDDTHGPERGGDMAAARRARVRLAVARAD